MNTAHPWHGVGKGDQFPALINAFIEITPFDTVKYELHKESGLLKIDRPQQFSNYCPALYGFIPQTYCGKRTGEYCTEKTGLHGIVGDGDPLDICVLSESHIHHNNILLQCIPVGGFRMIDKGEADDKIIAVMKDDPVYGHIRNIADLPHGIVLRLLHYFKTYKLGPDDPENRVQITSVYNADESMLVMKLAAEDYQTEILKA